MNIRKLIREEINRLFLKEEAVGKHLIVIDVQPEYADGFGHMASELAEYINENQHQFTNLTFLFNGPDLGMIEESEYRFWWMEEGLDEDIAYNAHFYDKGYAFFRYCMDEGIDEEQIVNLIKYMIKNGVNDTRDLDENFWNIFIEEHGNEDIRGLMEFSGDALHIPDLMDELKNYNNIVLTGGGINECLKEVEIALDALGKKYLTWNKFTY